jgi:hypothetical protein
LVEDAIAVEEDGAQGAGRGTVSGVGHGTSYGSRRFA